MPLFKCLPLFAPLILLLVAGCAGAEGDEDRVDVYETTGKITLNGKPLVDAVVSFSPKGKYPAAIGRTDSSGSYTLRTYEPGDGAAAGDFTVLVTKAPPASSDSVSTEDAHAAATAGGGGNARPAAAHAQAAKNAPKSEVPERYGLTDKSGLTATVTADGENTFNFDLEP